MWPSFPIFQTHTLSEHTQQFRLKLERQFADFVQKKGGPLASSKRPELGGRRPGKGPFFAAEQLAFNQFPGQGRTVYLHQCPFAVRAESVEGARAISSLPVPVSPIISTGESKGATCSTLCSTYFSASL